MRPDLEFNKNEDQFKQLVQELHHKSKKLKLGGGDKKIDEQHQKGKLTARERIDYLTDKGSVFWRLEYLQVKACTKNKEVARLEELLPV